MTPMPMTPMTPMNAYDLTLILSLMLGPGRF